MNTPLKRCPGCEIWQPTTPEFFTRRKSRPDGLDCYCKLCNTARAKQWAEANRDRKQQADRDAYKANPERNKQNARKWRAENPERKRDNARKWNERNRESERERKRKWDADNPDKVSERSRRKYRKFKDRISQRNSAWAKANPIKRQAIFGRRRARKRSYPDTLTAAQWQHCLDYFNHCCAVCDRPLNGLFHTAHADHWIPLSDPVCPGTVATNMIPLCGGIDGCNNSKHAKPAAQWLESKYGYDRAHQILTRIEAYFDWVRSRLD